MVITEKGWSRAPFSAELRTQLHSGFVVDYSHPPGPVIPPLKGVQLNSHPLQIPVTEDSPNLGRNVGSFWERMKGFTVRNPEMHTRVEKIKLAIGRSRAPATCKAFSSSYKRFKHFCRTKGITLDDVTEVEFAVYLQDLADSSSSAAPVMQAVAAVSWYSQMAGRQDPTKYQVISAIVSAAKHAAPPTKHKEPVTIEHLKAIRNFSRDKDTYSAACTYTLSLALYASCSRLDETITLRRKHIKIHHNYVRIFIPSSKTDQYKGGVAKYMRKGRVMSSAGLQKLAR